MALTNTKRKDLLKKQAKGIIEAKGTITFLDQIELSVKSEPLSGLIKQVGETKTGCFIYAFTGDEGHFKFYSQKELEEDEVNEHAFTISTTKDGKTFNWY